MVRALRLAFLSSLAPRLLVLAVLSALAVSTAIPCIAHAQDGVFVGTWAASPVAAHAADAGKTDQTLREIVHVSVAGRQFVRVTFSNEFGADPLTIGAATVALRGSGDKIESPVALAFAGKPQVVIPPGAMATSDPAHFVFPALSDVAVSVFLPAQPMTTVTQHSFADQTNYIAPGNQVSAPSLQSATENVSWRFVKDVQVEEIAGIDGSIVCLGDSITDGAHSTRDANDRWPNVLAERLQAQRKTGNLAGLGVLDEGIGGNRILHERAGPSALSRFDRDVLAQPGVKYLIILEGINDIGHSDPALKPYNPVTADALIAAYTQMAERAHAHGIKVYGATLTPYVGAKYEFPAGEAMREALNQWIRTTHELDGFIDFEKAVRDPANPTTYLPAYDSGDHLHPSDAGYRAMGDSIDLKLFEK